MCSKIETSKTQIARLSRSLISRLYKKYMHHMHSRVQRSLAPLWRFRGSHITTAHAHQCCRFQSYAETVPSPMKLTSEIYKAWTTFLGSTTTAVLQWRLSIELIFNVKEADLLNLKKKKKKKKMLIQVIIKIKMGWMGGLFRVKSSP